MTHLDPGGVVRAAAVLSVLILLPCRLDAGTSECPTLLGRWPYGSAGEVAAADGSLAYLANGTTLVVVDLSDPAAPTPLGELDLGEAIDGIATANGTVYVAAGRAGLLVVDAADPRALRLVAASRLPGRTAKVAVAGPLLYLLGDNSPAIFPGSDARFSVGWLRVLDVSRIAAPVEVGLLEHRVPRNPWTPWYQIEAAGLAVSGGFAYALWRPMTNVEDAVHVIDVSVSTTPHEVARCCTAGELDGAEAEALAVHGSTLYLAGPDVVGALDVRDPGQPVPLGLLHSRLYPTSLAAGDGLLFVATYPGLVVLDVSDPRAIQEVGHLGLPSSTRRARVALAGNRVLLTAAPGMRVVDVSSPAAPVAVGLLDTPGDPQGVDVDGDLAYVATAGGLQVLDISDPAHPQSESFTELGWSSGVAVDGDLAAVFGYNSLWAVDVSDPRRPEVLSHMWAGDVGIAVAVSSPFAYLISGGGFMDWSGLETFDLSAGVRVGSLGTEGPHDIALLPGYALLGASPGLVVVDVTAPSSPVVASTLELDGAAFGVAVEGRLAYLADFDGLRIADLSDPTIPVEVGVADVPFADAVAVRDGVAYVGSGNTSEMRVLDVSDPAAPVQIGQHTLPEYYPGAPIQVAAGGGHVCTARRWDGGGLEIFAECRDARQTAYLPGVAHLPGYSGSRWRSDLEVCNLGRDQLTCQVEFLARDRANESPPTRELSLAPGRCERHLDVVDELFALEESGALRVSAGAADRIVLSARTYNETAEGTYGAFMRPYASAEAARFGDRAALVHLASSADLAQGFRTNLGLLNTTASRTALHIELFASDGTPLGTVAATLDAWEYRQVNRVFERVSAGPLDDGYAVLWTSTPGGAFLTFASLVDNRTGDGTTISAAVNDGSTGTTLTPVARVPGANGTLWRSSTEVCNLVATDRAYSLSLLGTGGDAGPAIPFQLARGRCTRHDDVVAAVFGLDEATGVLGFEPDGDGLVAVTRTYDDSASGTYGTLALPVPARETLTAGERGALIQLSQSADPARGFRSNLLLFNAGAAELAAEVELYSAEAAHLGSLAYQLAPAQLLQVNRVFAEVTSEEVVDGYAVVSTPTPEGRLLVSASSIDNLTGDSFAVPAVRVP